MVAAGCSSDSTGVETSAAASNPATTAATSTGIGPTEATSAEEETPTSIASGDTATTGTTTTSAPLGDPAVSLVEIDGFNQPVGMSWRPTDGQIYVVEQDGRIVMLTDGRPGAVALDMTDLTNAEGERGLLGLTVDAEGTLAYVNYTDNAGNTQIDEYAIAADGTFEPATRRAVLEFAQPYPNHNGGDLAFGPDHMLYIGTGDGGSGGDPERRALDLGEWLGKMLRIDPHPGSDAGYTVPPDNPFVGVDGARPEIWSIGLRNPWRFSFDRSTGDLWIADVGQGQWEEVDVAWAADGGGRGMNFGWSALGGEPPVQRRPVTRWCDTTDPRIRACRSRLLDQRKCPLSRYGDSGVGRLVRVRRLLQRAGARLTDRRSCRGQAVVAGACCSRLGGH